MVKIRHKQIDRRTIRATFTWLLVAGLQFSILSCGKITGGEITKDYRTKHDRDIAASDARRDAEDGQELDQTAADAVDALNSSSSADTEAVAPDESDDPEIIDDVSTVESSPETDPGTQFEIDIFPLVQSKCADCHSPMGDKVKPFISNYSQVLKVVEAGGTKTPEEPLIQRLHCSFEEGVHDFGSDDIKLIQQWIDDGLL